MLIDARQVESEACLKTQVCVIGSGPAGLTVATRLASCKVDVIVVETGGRDLDSGHQRLSDVVGPGVGGATERARAVGGNSNVWSIKLADKRLGVRYLPLDPIDFDQRDDVAGSGWPFDRSALADAYRTASEICGMGAFSLAAGPSIATMESTWGLDPSIVESKIFRFGPRTAFSGALANEATRSPHVRLLAGATVVEIIGADASSPAQQARCRRLDGTEFTVSADTFVLANGGIGNAHLLLASNSVRPAGLGNGHDLVGRYLQDHPILRGGSLVPSSQRIWNESGFYDLRMVDGHNVLGHLALSRDAIERHGLTGLSASLFPRLGARRAAGVGSTKALAQRVRGRVIDRDISGEIRRSLMGVDGLAVAGYRKIQHGQSMLHGFGRGGWSEMPNLHRKFHSFEIVHQAEQRPDRGKRVTLTRDRDAVGMPIAKIEWRWDHEDARLAGLGRRLLIAELERAGIGTVIPVDDDELPGLDARAGSAHHSGTTRMSPSASTGVVDADGRVHDTDNVYVVGSSTFPTSGYANPTFTIVALAVRLADHLGAMTTQAARAS